MYRPKNLMFQEGGPMESQQMEQPGQEQQIMQMVAQALQQGTPPEQVMQMLIEQGVPQEQAQMIIQEVMSQMQGQMSLQQPTNDIPQAQPMMQKGGMPNFKPKYNMANADFIDSSNYKRNFYNTPLLAMTPSRVPATPATYGWDEYKNHEYDTDLDWQLKQGNPYVMYTSNNPSVQRAVANESAAYNDYKNQLLQYIKANPKAKKQVERLTGFKFEMGGMRPKGLSYDY